MPPTIRYDIADHILAQLAAVMGGNLLDAYQHFEPFSVDVLVRSDGTVDGTAVEEFFNEVLNTATLVGCALIDAARVAGADPAVVLAAAALDLNRRRD